MHFIYFLVLVVLSPVLCHLNIYFLYSIKYIIIIIIITTSDNESHLHQYFDVHTMVKVEVVIVVVVVVFMYRYSAISRVVTYIEEQAYVMNMKSIFKL